MTWLWEMQAKTFSEWTVAIMMISLAETIWKSMHVALKVPLVFLNQLWSHLLGWFPASGSGSPEEMVNTCRALTLTPTWGTGLFVWHCGLFLLLVFPGILFLTQSHITGELTNISSSLFLIKCVFLLKVMCGLHLLFHIQSCLWQNGRLSRNVSVKQVNCLLVCFPPDVPWLSKQADFRVAATLCQANCFSFFQVWDTPAEVTCGASLKWLFPKLTQALSTYYPGKKQSNSQDTFVTLCVLLAAWLMLWL